MREENHIIHSALDQTYSSGGRSFKIRICRLPGTGWTAEAVDEYGNSTVWDGEFATDQDAFNEIMKTIHEEGIESLIGVPSTDSSVTSDEGPLSTEEFAILDDFLAGGSMQDTSMDVATLEGFLAAIAIGPRVVRPSEWVPWVWDMLVS